MGSGRDTGGPGPPMAMGPLPGGHLLGVLGPGGRRAIWVGGGCGLPDVLHELESQDQSSPALGPPAPPGGGRPVLHSAPNQVPCRRRTSDRPWGGRVLRWGAHYRDGIPPLLRSHPRRFGFTASSRVSSWGVRGSQVTTPASFLGAPVRHRNRHRSAGPDPDPVPGHRSLIAPACSRRQCGGDGAGPLLRGAWSDFSARSSRAITCLLRVEGLTVRPHLGRISGRRPPALRLPGPHDPVSSSRPSPPGSPPPPAGASIWFLDRAPPRDRLGLERRRPAVVQDPTDSLLNPSTAAGTREGDPLHRATGRAASPPEPEDHRRPREGSIGGGRMARSGG